jgi:hypothetical protein
MSLQGGLSIKRMRLRTGVSRAGVLPVFTWVGPLGRRDVTAVRDPKNRFAASGAVWVSANDDRAAAQGHAREPQASCSDHAGRQSRRWRHKIGNTFEQGAKGDGNLYQPRKPHEADRHKSGVGGGHHIHSSKAGVCLSGCGAGPIFAKGGWLGPQSNADNAPAARRIADGASEPKTGTRYPVRCHVGQDGPGPEKLGVFSLDGFHCPIWPLELPVTGSRE